MPVLISGMVFTQYAALCQQWSYTAGAAERRKANRLAKVGLVTSIILVSVLAHSEIAARIHDVDWIELVHSIHKNGLSSRTQRSRVRGSTHEGMLRQLWYCMRRCSDSRSIVTFIGQRVHRTCVHVSVDTECSGFLLGVTVLL